MSPGRDRAKTATEDPLRVAFWLTGGKVLHTALVFLIPLLLARTLTVAEYGDFKQIDLVAGLLWPFVVLSLDRSLTNYLPRPSADHKGDASTVFWTVMAASIVTLGPLLAFPRVGWALFSLTPSRALGLAMATHSLAIALSTIAQRGLIATNQGRTAALAPIVLELPYVFGLTIVWATRGSLTACCWVVAAHSVLTSVVVAAILVRRRLLGFQFDWRALRRHLGFALPLWVIYLVNIWSYRIDRYLVNSFFGSEAFAIYAVGMGSIPILQILPSAVRDAVAPVFARYESEGRRSEIARLWKDGSEAVLPVCLLATAGQLALAHILIPVLYTDAYVPAITLFQLSASITFLGVFSGLDGVLRAFSAFRFLATLSAGAFLLRLALGIAVLPLRSLVLQGVVQTGVAFLSTAAYLAYARTRLEVSWRELLPTRGWPLGLLLAAACWTTSILAEPHLAALPRLGRVAIMLAPWAAAGLLLVHRLRAGLGPGPASGASGL